MSRRSGWDVTERDRLAAPEALADRLGVAPAQAGEATTPQLRFEQPWPQWLLVFTVLGSAALIVWLYRHEGKASRASKMLLAGAADRARPPGDVHALGGRPLGRADRAALLDDHGRRLGERADRRPVREARGSRRRSRRWPAGRLTPEQTEPTRLAIAKGLILQGPAPGCSASCRSSTRSGSICVSNSARLLAEVDRPADVGRRVEKLRAIEADGQPVAAGRRRPPGADRAARRPAVGDRAASPTARPPRASRSPRPPSSPRGRGCRSTRSAWAAPSRPATSS